MSEENTIVKPKPKTVKKKRKKTTDYVVELLKRIVIGVVVIWALLTFVFGITAVHGNYMFPALRDGDLVITYRFDKPTATQVVAYKTDSGTRIGRVVASAGDVVDITEAGELIVNGSRISEEIFYPTKPVAANVTYPYTVPEKSVFVLNDYRTLENQDSRSFGAVSLKKTKGVVTFVFRRRGF